MPNNPTVNAVETLLTPVIEALGIELYDVAYFTEQGQRILRLYIDKPDGVSLHDCEQVSRAVDPVLDAHDPINQAYNLQVSSPGIERKLVKERHFTRYTGSQVEVKLYQAIEKQKVFTGTLTGFDGQTVTVEGTQQWQFPWEDIAYCRLVYTGN